MNSSLNDIQLKALSVLEPPKKMTPVSWANENRFLSASSSSEPGKYSTDRIKYVEEILDTAIDPRIEQIVVMKSAQVGMTEMLLTLLGYFIDCNPAPMLYVMPTVAMSQDLVKDRLDPMLKETPALNGKIDFSHLSGNTLLHKSFPGGQLVLAGSNSPASLSSRPISKLFLDEVDRFPASSGNEGDPVNLAIKRTQTFKNRKIFMISTPTIKNFSRIEKAFSESDQRFFYVPCLYCQKHQILEWENVKWENEYYSAKYHCSLCNTPWSDLQRWIAIKLGHWEKLGETNKIAGFHLNELLSPWSTVKDMVKNYLEAKRGGLELLKTFDNVCLGIPFEEKFETTPLEDLLNRRESFNLESIPNEVKYLTVSVDTQDDRLELAVIGWGTQQESWVLSHKVINSSPDTSIGWKEIEKIILANYSKQDKSQLQISVSVIDSGGHYTEQVYKFCNEMVKKHKRKVYAIKGANGERPIWPRKSSRSKTHINYSFSIVGVDNAKQMIFDRLKITDPGPRYIHFSHEIDKVFFEQLQNEVPVYSMVKGRPKKSWVLKAKKNNESFDLMVYSLAALYSHIAHYEQSCESIITPTIQVGKSSYLEKFS